MADQNSKGEDFVQKAEKKLSGWGIFGSKYDDAADLYEKACNCFKLAKNCTSFAFFLSIPSLPIWIRMFYRIFMFLESKHEAASSYVDAANCYKKISIQDATESLNQAVNIFLEIGRLNMAARYCKDLGELYEQEQNPEKAIEYFERAADLFQSEEVTTSANQCNQKVAQLAAQLEQEASVGGSGEASSNSGAAIPSVASTTSGTSDSKRLAVNAPGNRSDPGWKHGIAVDENPKKVQCKYCQKVINGGIYRLKHHLAGTQKDVGACKAVSDDVRKEMWKIVSSLQENLIKRAKEIEGRSSDSSPLGQYEDEEVEGAKRQRREIAKNPADLFKKRDNAANYKAAGEMLMGKRKRLYWTPCAAHCIDLMLEDFEKKIPIHKETIARGKKITTYIYSRTALISLLHHFTKEKDLIRPATTRFATSYLTLGCLNDNKGALIRMFTSKEWKSSQFAKTKDGKVIENVVMDKDFWKSIITCLRSAYPLIKVLRLVDSDEKPAMGFIYEEMDRAKEKIQAAFNGIKKRYPKAIEIYEAIAKHSINNNLLKYSVKGILLNAGICQLCKGDVVAITNALERYQEIDPTFSGSRECKLLSALADSMDEEDVGKFTEALHEYDSMTRLDAWKTTLLLRVKNAIKQKEEEEDDLT
ncbi:hypothetical protein ZIOFF_032103 [Zingiber officinale]|uniref:BED-type domain-containing protein n=1 Tax=Zingiber officinale TaxID=94328 RepID=A0A8J5GFT6_ZINOF|nr:hypothetical protein ZIOFF_032103 [Zingiber officinale]